MKGYQALPESTLAGDNRACDEVVIAFDLDDKNRFIL